MWMRTLIFILCRSGFLFADRDPTFHPDKDPDPDPSFQIKAQTLEKGLKIGLNSIHFGLSSAI
jgi:hypothetical protein